MPDERLPAHVAAGGVDGVSVVQATGAPLPGGQPCGTRTEIHPYCRGRRPTGLAGGYDRAALEVLRDAPT